jgi:hypothetical protein
MKTCAYCGRENDDGAAECFECGTKDFNLPLDPVPSQGLSTPGSAFKPLSPEDLHRDLVTLLTCRTLLEADMIVSQLESAGITTFVPDQFLMQNVAFNLNTYGFVRVQVPPGQYETAKSLLSAAPKA